MAGSCYADDTFTVIAEYKLYQTAPLVAVGFTKDEAKSTNGTTNVDTHSIAKILH